MLSLEVLELSCCSPNQGANIMSRHPRSKIADLGPLRHMRALTFLGLAGSPLVTDLSPIAACLSVRTLLLTACRGVADLSPLSGMTAVVKLCLERTNVRSLQPLSNMALLEELNASFTAIDDLAPLSTCLSLKRLEVASQGIADVTPVGPLVSLTHLDLGNCPNLKSLDPLTSLVALKSLFLDDDKRGNKELVEPLKCLTALTDICFGLDWW